MSGGSSKSSTTTSVQDDRMVLDGGSIGVTDSSNNTVNVLDAGAIQAALDLAGPIVTSALALANNVAVGAGEVLDKGVQIQEQNSDNLATAYTDSKGTKDVLVIGSLMIGAVAIAFMLRK